MNENSPEPSSRAAFRYSNFRHYMMARFLTTISSEMQSVAVGWQVYEITKRPLDLGLVGLAQFLPGVVLFLAAGHAADHFDRRNLLVWCNAGFAICASLLLKITYGSSTSIYAIYVVLVLIGVFRTFSGPASQALLPQLVSERDFSKAEAWGASMRQGANILGPSLGGVLYAVGHGAWIVYVASAIVSAAAMLAMLGVPRQQRAWPRTRVRISTVFAGLRYIWRQKLILGTISLDLFAVLLGGAVAVLPVYESEILNTGTWGLGIV